jgi:hypothetical protein
MYVLRSRFGMYGRLMDGVYRVYCVRDRLLIDLLDVVERIDGLERMMRLRGSCRNRRGRNLIRLIRNLGRRERRIGECGVVDGSPDHQLDLDGYRYNRGRQLTYHVRFGICQTL